MTLDLSIEVKEEFEELFLENMPELIKTGGEGSVYNIGKGKALKVIRQPSRSVLDEIPLDSDKVIKHEYKMMRDLFKEGIKVPRPYGIYNVRIEGIKYYKRGLIMEFIDGVPIFNFKFNELDKIEAERLMGEEIEKAVKKGFTTGVDAKSYNTLWLPLERDIRLIDFTQWNRPRN